MKKYIKNISLASVIGLVFTSCGGNDDEAADSISVNGSDTMLQVGLAWAEAYKTVKPDISVSVNGEGSGTGIKALINGTVQIAHSSREIKETEASAIKEKHGKDPVAHIVGYDGIAVFVHPDNPVKKISLPQLRSVWGEGGAIENWKDLGGTDAEIKRAGRSNSSGTYAFYKKAVLGKDADGKGIEFKQDTSSMPGSTAVVELCMTTASAMGYSGMSYKTDEVAWLAVSKEDGAEAYEPSIENVSAGNYPIARPLYIYTVGEPEGIVKEYIDWVKTGGQDALQKEGFVPLG